MLKFPRRWKEVDKISYLQRKIIVNSILYYEYDKSTLSDKEFDSLSQQLVQMQKDFNGDVEKDTEYGYMMYDFDGSTGFDLPSRLNSYDREYLTNMTLHYIDRHFNKKPEAPPKKPTPQRRKLF